MIDKLTLGVDDLKLSIIDKQNVGDKIDITKIIDNTDNINNIDKSDVINNIDIIETIDNIDNINNIDKINIIDNILGT